MSIRVFRLGEYQQYGLIACLLVTEPPQISENALKTWLKIRPLTIDSISKGSLEGAPVEFDDSQTVFKTWKAKRQRQG